MAHLLSGIEREHPGTLRMSANIPLLGRSMQLVASVGMRKPLFKSQATHLYDSVLSNSSALEALLKYSVLCGNSRQGLSPLGDSWSPAWNAEGRYCRRRSVGIVRFLQVSRCIEGAARHLIEQS